MIADVFFPWHGENKKRLTSKSGHGHNQHSEHLSTLICLPVLPNVGLYIWYRGIHKKPKFPHNIIG
jgi:hypothetical protein